MCLLIVSCRHFGGRPGAGWLGNETVSGGGRAFFLRARTSVASLVGLLISLSSVAAGADDGGQLAGGGGQVGGMRGRARRCVLLAILLPCGVALDAACPCAGYGASLSYGCGYGSRGDVQVSYFSR